MIAYLVENDNVYELARDIVANGYLPTEIPVVVREDLGSGVRLYVLEGNRRLTALKALESPECVPTEHQAKFRKLAGQVPKGLLRSVTVVHAPNRDAATPLLLDRHTTTQVHKWTPAQQAAFYHRLHVGGRSIEDIAKLAGTQPGDERQVLREDLLYRLACALDLDDATKAIVTNPNKFKLTNLSRPFGFPEVRQALGIEFHDKDLLRGTINKQEFTKGFKRLVT